MAAMMSLMTISVFAADGKEAFAYDLQPGTEEWGQLDHGERVLALQIPDEVLKSMSTEDLVNAVLDYPCFIDMIFYDTYQDGFEVVLEHFNGLQELVNREDAGRCLLNAYKDMELSQIMSEVDENKKFEESLNLLYLETLLAQPKISKNMSIDDLEVLEVLAKTNYELQTENQEESASLTVSGYYDSLAVQQGINMYDSTLTVKTPNGSSVSVIIRTGIDTAYNNRAAIKSSIEKNYPGVSVVGDATIKYNCHAYAWAGSTSLWMNDPSKYWSDGSYRLKASDSPSAIGQKAYYGASSGTHSGNVIRLSGNAIKSKWGELSLVEHSIGNCPYFFIPLSVKFYGR